MQTKPSSLSYLTSMSVKKPSEAQPLSEKAQRQLNHQVILNLMHEFYTYQIEEAEKSPEDAKEQCLDVLSSMVEDGRCTAAAIEQFRQNLEQGEEASTESIGMHDIFKTSTLMDFAQNAAEEKLHADEQEAVKEFNSAVERMENAASQLTELFYENVVVKTRDLVSTYRGFDEKFAERF